MADYLLDTNILSYWYDTTRPEHPNVVVKVNLVRQPNPITGYVSRLFNSVVTLGEIEYGHRVASSPDPVKQTAYKRFVQTQCPIILEITKHVAEQFGELRAWLFNNCTTNKRKTKTKRAEELIFPATGKELGIDENDIWITAVAMTHNLVLVTHDSRGNYGKVLAQFATTLQVEDWAI